MKNCKIEIRIPYVPNFNDNEINFIGEFLSKLKNATKVRVLAYHNFASSKYESLGIKNNLPNDLPSKTEIDKALKTLKSFGLNVV